MLLSDVLLVRHPAMHNPTLVVPTGRSNLDDQLFGHFQRRADILGQTLGQGNGREHLRAALPRAALISVTDMLIQTTDAKLLGAVSSESAARIVGIRT